MRALLVSVLSVALLVLAPDSANATPGGPDSGPLDRLVALVADRLDTADAVAAAKWATAERSGTPPVIDDPAREADVYDSMARLGERLDLPENWIRQVFFGQIEANKVVQRGLIAGWRFDPAGAPAAPPDLSTVRPRIDRLNAEIVDEVAAHRGELSGPDCAERLAHSVFGAFATWRGDALHRVALVRATTVLCAP
ncbi:MULTISPECIES: gamma subclass chorismate mutase AroQ [unclassified Nocardia]|uniref:gamma subclass chorismate mutase AroQ n=1 Tax=unclassified Nocardia TaxID=2637762 RepID=UPI001CE3C587|nr:MULTISPECIES: gamma subclass chorismate mutase AroQ [unclassified Nocardia]